MKSGAITGVSESRVGRQLLELSGDVSLGRSLQQMGLLPDAAMDFRIEESEWRRGGAETYICRFQVITGDSIRSAVMKAVVAFSPGSSIEAIMNTWLARRRLLTAEGIEAPVLFASGLGLIVEGYVPFSLRDHLKEKAIGAQLLCDQIIVYAAVLSKLGFAPIGPFDDLRTDGKRLMVVDFGEDLGPPRATDIDDDSLYLCALQWFMRHTDIHTIDIERARRIFDLTKRRRTERAWVSRF